MKNYLKYVLYGFITLFGVILFFYATELIYFTNSELLNPYIDIYKPYLMALLTIIFLYLTYLFYRKAKVKSVSILVCLAAPYCLLMLTLTVASPYVPRLPDLLYMAFGLYLIFIRFKPNTTMLSRRYALLVFCVSLFLIYPFIYKNLEFMARKGTTDKNRSLGKFDMSLKNTKGEVFKTSDFYGQTVCIDMWSSSCGSCIQAMPDFEKLNKHYKANPDFKIISLFCPMKPHQTYEWFLKYIKEEFPYDIDYYYIDQEEFKQLEIYKFPEFLLINKQNHLEYRGIIHYMPYVKDNIYTQLNTINENQ